MSETPLYLQLYTVREACAADLHATLQRVAVDGFTGVELAGLHGHSSADVRRWLDETGLKACSAHVGIDDLNTDIGTAIADAQTIGYTRIVVPWTEARDRQSTQTLIQGLESANSALADAGLTLGYHNHEFEFERRDDGSRMIDEILACEAVFIEPDLGWIWFAGEDPLKFVADRVSRCPVVHIKDFLRPRERTYCPVGAGAVGFGMLLPRLVELGVECLVLEQDESPEQDPLDAAAASLQFSRRILAAGDGQ